MAQWIKTLPKLTFRVQFPMARNMEAEKMFPSAGLTYICALCHIHACMSSLQPSSHIDMQI